MAGKPRYLIAYAFASGHIFFDNAVPAHALEIGRGPQKALRDFIESQCIVGFGDDAPKLVPGLAEAESQAGKVAALEAWCAKIAPKKPEGVLIATPFGAGSAAAEIAAHEKAKASGD
jgi:hypothetical protein